MIYQPSRRGVLTRAPTIGDAPFTHQTTRQNTQQHQECTVTTNAHPPAQRERTCMHPHKSATTSAYVTGPFSHAPLGARHHGNAGHDSPWSTTREHCQCAAGRCRGSLGHAGVTPAARGLRPGRAGRLGHSGVTPAARGLRPGRAGRLGHAGSASATRAPSRSRGPPRTRAPPTTSIVSARAVKRWGSPLNVWSRFASFPRCASRLH